MVYHDSTGWLQRDIYNESKNQITKGGEKALAEGDAVAKANPGFESGAIVYRNTATGELASGDFTSGGGPKGTWKSNSKQMNADLSTLSSDGSTWETAASVHIHSGDNGSINYSSAPSTDDINNSVQDASGNNQVNIIMAGTSKGVGRQVAVLTVAQGTTGPRVSERTRNHAGVRQDLQKFSPAPTYLVGRVKVTDTAVKVLVQPASKGK